MPVGGNESFPGPAASSEPLLELDDLTVWLDVAGTRRAVLRGVSLSVDPGESVGLVGESGSGKTMTARAVSRLLPPGAGVEGQIRFAGRDIGALRGGELRSYRNRISMVFQDPRAHINPVRRIGDFMTEALCTNLGVSGPEARRRAADTLRQVGIEDGERRLRQYPHQLSGGMLQRVMIAAALLTEPLLLLADEPTTALDVTTQAEVMAILDDLRRDLGLAMLFITHDLELAAAVCDRRGAGSGAPGYRAPGGPAAGDSRPAAVGVRRAAGRMRVRAPVPALPRRLPRAAARHHRAVQRALAMRARVRAARAADGGRRWLTASTRRFSR